MRVSAASMRAARFQTVRLLSFSRAVSLSREALNRVIRGFGAGCRVLQPAHLRASSGVALTVVYCVIVGNRRTRPRCVRSSPAPAAANSKLRGAWRSENRLGRRNKDRALTGGLNQHGDVGDILRKSTHAQLEFEQCAKCLRTIHTPGLPRIRPFRR